MLLILRVLFVWVACLCLGEAKTVAQNWTATFEVPNNGEGPVFFPLNGSVPGGYNALSWTNWYIPSYQSLIIRGLCSGICSHSYYAQAAVNDTTKPATITSIYTNSAVKNFRLRSFWFGCLEYGNVDNPQAPKNLPEPASCTVTVKGYKNGQTASPALTTTFEFTPVITANTYAFVNQSVMTQAVLPRSWRKLTGVEMEARLRGPPPQGVSYNLPIPILSVDDVFYTVHNKTDGAVTAVDLAIDDADDEDGDGDYE